MNISVSAPAESASSTAYWISGLSTIGSISFGLALVTGRNRLPSPATGNTALVTLAIGIEVPAERRRRTRNVLPTREREALRGGARHRHHRLLRPPPTMAIN